MSAERVVESVIVADCGNAVTRAVLVELVDDAYRFVAQGESPSTVEPPAGDLSVGLREAVAALEQACGRRFMERHGPIMPQEENGNGTDAFLTTVSAGPPLRLAVLTVGAGPLVGALIDVARRTPTTVLPAVTLDESGQLDDRASEASALVQRYRPDLLLLAAEGQSETAVARLLGVGSAAMTATALAGGEAPAVLFVGDERWHNGVAANFGGGVELGMVATANTTPDAVAALIEQEILDFANRRLAASRPGFESLAAWGASAPLPRSHAIDLVNRFMAMHFGAEVLTVELAEGSVFCWARGQEHLALNEPALDLGLGAANLLSTLAVADVTRWLPFALSEDELVAWVLNRAIRPFTIPTTRRDRLIEAALARELIRTGLAEVQAAGAAHLAPRRIVGGSFFARWPDPATAMLTLLDGVQPPAGIAHVALDRDGLLPAIGALGVADPQRAAQLFERDGLLDLGSCVTVAIPAGGEARGRLDYADGEAREFSVPAGSVARLPLSPERPAARLTIDAGGATTFEGETAPVGGLVGLIVDARPRPLALPRDEQARVALLQQWSEALK